MAGGRRGHTVYTVFRRRECIHYIALIIRT
jgi:hypothetical protein